MHVARLRARKSRAANRLLVRRRSTAQGRRDQRRADSRTLARSGVRHGMNVTARIAVLKFGGTSLRRREQRAVACRRMRDAREAGFAVVAVVSAMGRTARAVRDRFAARAHRRTLRHWERRFAARGRRADRCCRVCRRRYASGNSGALLLSGAQAGIVTDERLRRCDDSARRTARRQRVIERGCRSRRRRLSRRQRNGAPTTLGRGGTDLSAIAIGHALDADRVDIYTDVSGAMTADPRRVPDARRSNERRLAEMSELANHGAKVMHHKAAEYAGRTGTRYAIKGLDTDRGTVVDECVDHHRRSPA